VLIAILAVQMIFFCVQYTFFGVQEKKFERPVQTFAASLPPFSVSFCRLMVRVLPYDGASFGALWHKFCRLMACVLPPYVKFLKRSTKVCCIFLGGVCKSFSMDSLLLSKIIFHRIDSWAFSLM